jgi:3-oxoacyl-[acyl-carrier-protein] synthase-3
MGIKIHKPTIYLGSKKIRISTISKFSKKTIRTKIGSEFIHKELNKSLLDIAYYVGVKAIKNKIKPTIIILVSQTQDRIFPSIAEQIAEKLNVDRNALVFTLSSGCSGFVQALYIANKLLDSVKRSALIICVEKYSKYIDKNDLKTKVLFSDAGSATLIEFTKDRNLLSENFGFDGNNCDSLSVNKKKAKNFLTMDGNKVFNFGLSNIPQSIKKCSLDFKVDKYIIHPGSKYMLDNIIKKSSIPQKKVLNSFNITGNTVSTSIPLIISKYYSKLKKKNLILLSGFGVGLSWATILIKWK